MIGALRSNWCSWDAPVTSDALVTSSDALGLSFEVRSTPLITSLRVSHSVRAREPDTRGAGSRGEAPRRGW